MKILAVNAGSSSLKFQVLEMPAEKGIASGLVERIGSDEAVFTIKHNGEKIVLEQPMEDHAVAVGLLVEGLIKNNIIQSLDEIQGVGHRVVQGGEKFQHATLITDEVVNEIEALNDLAPLHNPANITGIKAFRKALPNVVQVAIFDTTFHTTMDEVTYLYATPYEWYEKYGVRKYGFHGTSHQYVSEEAAKILNNKDAKIIVCHLGNGASICAVDGGKSIDTSMGFTPLEGIPMGTRSGNIDPAIIQFISEKEGRDLTSIIDDLNKNSGYLGVSGVSNDSRDIVNEMNSGNHRAKLAYEVQIKRIVDYIGSYYVQLGGLDALVFTAGIGENSVEVRKDITDKLAVLGVKVDPKLNETRGTVDITAADSKVKVFTIPTNEEVMIAREVLNFK